MVVDCLLPSQVRRLGSMTYAAARKAIKTSASECEIRGGEYVAFDRANNASTLKVWLPLAKEGDAKAQTYLGEMYEKGLGIEPDFISAAHWYLKAAEQGFSRAQINLGHLFEQGLGLMQDKKMALFWYQQASNIKGVSPQLKSKIKPHNANATILIIEPELDQRGIRIVTSKPNEPAKETLIIGQVQSPHAIKQVLINQKPVKLMGSMFKGYVLSNLVDIKITAIDEFNNKSMLTFPLNQSSQNIALQEYKELGMIFNQKNYNQKKYHALIIGNNNYKSLPILNTATKDAKAINQVLKSLYGFSTTMMIDVDRYQIVSALNDLKQNFSDDTHLLIYYAGHGQLDNINRRGYWLPIDAELNSPANWISNIMVTDMLNIMPAKQLLIIADSCYSGMMSRSALGVIDNATKINNKLELLNSLSDAKSRIAFTSGGIAPVLDSINGENSVFAAELIQALKNNKGVLTGYALFQAILPHVKSNVSKVGFEQVPEYAPLKFAGHETGDFVFYKLIN
ncbi:caspase family protein [Pseudoalteromonas denitrificans]|uniref:Sel1 repeat-containing protein n=1 Tax=Pseudoalteromonas denitrificans DSM 6059 TaxID=1123010 RepID=A0A1I1LS66_9GAMM|nr:caspase family protein [Pseudoalteromonas denitrificans]SFC75352.1 Sel1 repeat-containing protein [Pseudoalteromonas denitrificans DSM 6059]